jgi:hypothetical protein
MEPMGESGSANEAESNLEGGRWPHLAAVIAIVGVAIAMNPGVRDGASRLRAAALAQLRSPATHRVNLTTPRSGELALTEPIFHTVLLLRANEVETFRLSPAMSAEPFVQQRLIEGAWPIRFDDTSDFEVGYLSEHSECALVDRRNFDPGWRIPRRQAPLFAGKRGVRLARCR